MFTICRWTEFRKTSDRVLQADAVAFKADIFAHIAEVKLERRLAQELHQECAVRAGWVFGYDDKCGSENLHQPSPLNGRFAANVEGRYQYRIGLQGNLYPGELRPIPLLLLTTLTTYYSYYSYYSYYLLLTTYYLLLTTY